MTNVHYTSHGLQALVESLSYSAHSIETYVPKDAAETNIINDLKKLLKSKSISEAHDIIIYASADFKSKFNYVPVADEMAYFQGHVPTIDERLITKFVRAITDAQKKKVASNKVR